MKRAKKHRIKEEASGSVNPNEHDLAYYIHDRVELMHQVFSVLKPKELKAMAPECVRHISVNDLQELCTEELLGISSKRLCAILDGAEPPSDTESSSESSQERLETISLDSISSDDEILSQVTTKKKKHKHHSKGKSKKRRTQDSGDEAGNQDTSRRTGLTVLEILELQARARAIRAQLQKEQAAIASTGRPSESATGNSSDGEVEIKEEAAEVVEISSEDEKPNVQELQEKIATPSNETANNDANSKTITKKVNDLVITVPKNTTRKIRLRRTSILNKNPKTVVDTNVPTTSTSVSTTSTTEAAKAKANTNSQSTSSSTESNKTIANTNVQSEKQNPKESVITVETDKGKDKKKKRKKDKQKYKYGSDHDEITLQLSDTEKMDLLEDLDGKQFEKSSETEDSSADSDSDESVDKNKDIDNDKRVAKISKEKSKVKASKNAETKKDNLNEKEITVISKETNFGQKETKDVESTDNNKSDSENIANIVDNVTETNITDVSNDTRTEEVLKENDVVDKSDKNSETCDNTIMTSEVNNESHNDSNDIEIINENDNIQNTEARSRDLEKEKEVQNQEVEHDNNTQNTEARSRDLEKEKVDQNQDAEVTDTIKDKKLTEKDKSNETNIIDTEIQMETVDITQSKDNLMESGTKDNEGTDKRSSEEEHISKRSVEKSEGELSDRDSSEVEASEVKPDVVCISDDEVKGKKKKKKDKKCKKAKKAKKNKDFRESADQNFYTEISTSKVGSIQISDSNQIDINESENLVNTEESLNNEVILIQDTKKTDDSNTNSTEIGPNTDIDDDVYEILELSDDSSCYEVEEISISKEPTTEEIEAFTAKIDEIEWDRTINIDETEGDRTSDIEDLEHVSWKDRYLKSNKVKKVLNTANILNAIRKKNLDLKKKLQESKIKPIIENEVIKEIIPSNLEEGSIEQYNTLDTCNKYVNPVKDDEENQEIDKEKEIKDPVTKEMKKDAKQLLKMYKMLLKYNDTTKTKDMSKKRKKKKKCKDKDKSQSTVSSQNRLIITKYELNVPFITKMDALCTACMCSGRNLYLLTESGLYHVYEQIVNEISITECLNTKLVHICWECRALLRRFQRFKLQVQRCYMELLEHLQQDPPSTPKPRPSLLQPHNAHNVSYLQKDDEEPIELLVNVKIESLDSNINSEIDPIPYCAAPDDNKGKSMVIKDKKRERHKRKVKKKISKKKPKAEPEPEISDGPSDREEPLVDYNESLAEDELEKHIEATEEEIPIVNGVEKPKRRPRSKEVLPDKPICTDCGKTFSSKKTYRYHRNVLHKGQNRYPCPRCGRVYQWKSNLGRHMRTHKALDTGELYCEKCDRSFASVATYRQHMRISRRHVPESDYNFMCNECGKKFLDKTRLRDHIDWEHLKKVKYRCQICNNAFKCHATLYVHMQNIHTNKEKKDHLCHVCGKSYQNPSKLKYHIVAMHTSQTPHRCGHCGAAFGWYSSLYRHVREVHYGMKVPTRNVKKSKKLLREILLHPDENPALAQERPA
ncbi:uncharacterized protein [Epargyreus clarus]|uniref:uncharacterized protein n=1 Tax=Epargyreus clarus TaxID=520877 RepID=UPI003C2D03CA